MRNKTTNSIIQSIYSDPSNPASFSSIKKLHKAVKKIDKNISYADIKFFLKNQDAYTLHYPTKKILNTKNNKCKTKNYYCSRFDRHA